MEETLPKKLIRTVNFMIGERVKHVLAEDSVGIVTGIMVHEKCVSYEVRWILGGMDFYDGFELEQFIL